MLKKLLIAADGLLISAPVLADVWHGHYRHHARHYQPPYRPVIVVQPRVVYYPPAPAYYYAPPPRVYYAPPAPVFYPPSGISIRLNFPL